MPLIEYPTIEDLDDESRELLNRMRNDRGELPAFPRMLANNSAILEATSGQFFEVMYGGNLEPPLKQLAFVVVSLVNECPYCVASQGDELVNTFGLPETYIDAIATGKYAEFSDRQRAVAEFARQAARDPKHVTDAHLESLRSVGFDTADLLELTTVVAQAAFANTIADVTNIQPSDQSLELDQYYPERTRNVN